MKSEQSWRKRIQISISSCRLILNCQHVLAALLLHFLQSYSWVSHTSLYTSWWSNSLHLASHEKIASCKERRIIKRMRNLSNFLVIFCSSSFICTSCLHFNALNIDLSHDSTFSELLDFRMYSFCHSSKCFKIFT